ncbi:hypothetical protein TrRE_jg3375 [Triparma retinervis]|uniref:Helicase ATP-binding domain-containing protein n=1 Tax=Triparma retinervis TaxID=2557542 RepID=A0A9W7EEJ2_9STRA|nr:hypothetical protein TrRE_jg3375 [Triparma retinervis]
MKIVNLIPRKGVTRPHQRDAIVSVENAWQQGITRAQVIMPGGSGKTFVGMKVIEKRLGVEDGVVVVCVPTLTLLEQTLRAYKIYMEEDALDWENDVLCVGSKMSFEDVKLTTKREHVEAFCGEGGRKLILATYQSAVDCLRGTEIDLLVLDEAHFAGGGGVYSSILDDKEINAKRRVFMTATPKARNDVKDLYGEIVYNLSYNEAIERNITAPIRLIAHKLKNASQVPEVPGHNTFDREREREWKAKVLVDACETFGLRKVIAFSRTNQRAKELTAKLGEQDAFRLNLLVNGTVNEKVREDIIISAF